VKSGVFAPSLHILQVMAGRYDNRPAIDVTTLPYAGGGATAGAGYRRMRGQFTL
jgi:hypothetical protein